MDGLSNTKLIIATLILISPCLTCVKGTATKNQTTQDQNPILFLHGWTKSKSDWTTMKEWFGADGWSKSNLYAYNFDDTRDCSFQAYINNALKIKQWVDAILNETKTEKIDLVGHSDGGLSSRYYIKFLGGNDTVDDYVSLGTPHHGDPIIFSSCNELIPYLLNLNEGDETPGGIMNDTVGDRVDPINNSIIYNSTHIPGNISYTSIYSPHDGFIPEISSPLDGAFNISVDYIGHSQLYQDWSVYKLVRVAVNDLKDKTFLTTPLTSTTTTATTTEPSSSFTLFLVVFLLSVAGISKRK